MQPCYFMWIGYDNFVNKNKGKICLLLITWHKQKLDMPSAIETWLKPMNECALIHSYNEWTAHYCWPKKHETLGWVQFRVWVNLTQNGYTWQYSLHLKSHYWCSRPLSLLKLTLIWMEVSQTRIAINNLKHSRHAEKSQYLLANGKQ